MQDEYLEARLGVDKAENEPSKVCYLILFCLYLIRTVHCTAELAAQLLPSWRAWSAAARDAIAMRQGGRPARAAKGRREPAFCLEPNADRSSHRRKSTMRLSTTELNFAKFERLRFVRKQPAKSFTRNMIMLERPLSKWFREGWKKSTVDLLRTPRKITLILRSQKI